MVIHSHMTDEWKKDEFLSAVHRVCLAEAKNYIERNEEDKLFGLFFHFANISSRDKQLYIHASDTGDVTQSFPFGYIRGDMYFEGYLASSEIDHENTFKSVRKSINQLIGHEESEEDEENRKELIALGLNFEILG